MMKRTVILLYFLLSHLLPSQAQLQMFFSADSLSSITSPLDLDSLFYWFAADVGVTDSLGGAIATDEGVGSWLDLSGRGHHVTQSTNGARPVWKATGGPGGYPCIQFDGTNDFLASSAHWWGSDDLTVFVVMKFGNATRDATEAIIARNNISQYQWDIRGMQASNSYNLMGWFWSTYANVANRVRQTDSPKSSSFEVITYIGDGDISAALYRDGVSQSLSTAVDGTGDGTIGDGSNPLSIGALNTSSTASTFLLGSISEIIVYTRALTATERTAIENYLNRKYDLYYLIILGFPLASARRRKLIPNEKKNAA